MQSRVPDVPAAMRRRLEFAYDHQGRRVRKIVNRWDAATAAYVPSVTHTFVWDGWLLLSETIRTPQSETRNSYTWGLDLSGSLGGAAGIGGLLAITHHATGLTLRVAHDGSGNVMSLLDSNNLTTAEYQYGPFGEELRTTGEAAGNPWRFSTKYLDEETGLLSCGFRFLDSSHGRWISPDPAQSEGFLAESVYGFLMNSPATRYDALGLWSTSVHLDKTKEWAITVGCSPEAARQIAERDEAVDSGVTSPLSPFGQKYHFDRPWGGADSRLSLSEQHLRNAQDKCDGLRAGEDDAEAAIREMGLSLHPLQDWVAHGDHGRDQSGVITVWHNYFGEKAEALSSVPAWKYPDTWGLDAIGGPNGRPAGVAVVSLGRRWFGEAPPGYYPADSAHYAPGPLRQRLTEELTKQRLYKFLRYVKRSSIPCGQCSKLVAEDILNARARK